MAAIRHVLAEPRGLPILLVLSGERLGTSIKSPHVDNLEAKVG